MSESMSYRQVKANKRRRAKRADQEPPPPPPKPGEVRCLRCGVWLMLGPSLDTGVCGGCRARAERIRLLAERVNAGAGKRLGAAAHARVMFG